MFPELLEQIIRFLSAAEYNFSFSVTPKKKQWGKSGDMFFGNLSIRSFYFYTSSLYLGDLPFPYSYWSIWLRPTSDACRPAIFDLNFTLKMEAARSSEKVVSYRNTTASKPRRLLFVSSASSVPTSRPRQIIYVVPLSVYMKVK
jgi:hypothetical protein